MTFACLDFQILTHAPFEHGQQIYKEVYCATVVCTLNTLQVMGVGISSGANCTILSLTHWLNSIKDCSSVQTTVSLVVGHYLVTKVAKTLDHASYVRSTWLASLS